MFKPKTSPDIEAQFKNIFNREMTPEERRCFFLTEPPLAGLAQHLHFELSKEDWATLVAEGFQELDFENLTLLRDKKGYAS